MTRKKLQAKVIMDNINNLGNLDNYVVKMNDFNKLCENNNEKINAFINCICDGAPMKVKVDLEDVRIFCRGSTRTATKMCKTETICRLCFENVKVTDSICLNEHSEISTIVMALFPEMDFNCTENPVICPECSKNVTQQFRFKVKHSKTPSKYYMSFFSTSQENENKNLDETILVDLNEQFVQNCQKLAKVLQGTDNPQVCNDFKFGSHNRAAKRSECKFELFSNSCDLCQAEVDYFSQKL